ncbi:MAG: GyrI-like domain-containing protein [Myxococcota bacterium]
MTRGIRHALALAGALALTAFGCGSGSAGHSASEPAAPGNSGSAAAGPSAAATDLQVTDSAGTPTGDGAATGERPYAIEQLILTEQPALSIRDQAAPVDLQSRLTALIPRLVAHAMANQVEVAGPPFVRYHARSDTMIDFEAGIPVLVPGDGTDDIRPVALPAGPAIATVHVGRYEELPGAHQALAAWADSAGRKRAGPPWEVFMTNPLVERDPARWQTKVFLPLAP